MYQIYKENKMKNLNKILLCAISIILATFSLTTVACKDNNSTPSVQGKYYRTTSITYNGVTYNVGDDISGDTLEDDFMLVAFLENSVCYYYIYGNTGPCTWVQEHSTVTVIPTGEVERYTFTISGNTISISIQNSIVVTLTESEPYLDI